jgi:hypothetical protein
MFCAQHLFNSLLFGPLLTAEGTTVSGELHCDSETSLRRKLLHEYKESMQAAMLGSLEMARTLSMGKLYVTHIAVSST